MYVWKCWRDTRAFFFILLMIAAAAMPVAAVVCVGTHLLEDFGTMAFMSTFGLLLILMAVGLGTLGAIQEFTDKTVHFLFTKPRSRAYFVWTGWIVGCVELLTIAAVNLASGWLTLAHYSKNPFSSVLFGSIRRQDVVGVLIYTLIVYSITYALTAVLRDGLKGLGASVGITIGFQAVTAVARLRLKIDIPTPPLPIGSLPTAMSNIVWIIVALLFVVGAQLVVQRAEV
jgi:ABC-type transport system involved in multi-copper enzyme maturation permease subunit